MEYRNLARLPSLAESTYAVVLRNEAVKTYSEIAKLAYRVLNADGKI